MASLIESDLLVLLTDVPGFIGPDGAVIPAIRQITAELLKLAGGAGSLNGTGGMATKLQAASIAGEAGITTVIAPGRQPGILGAVLRGEPVGTRVLPSERRLRGRQRWIAFGSAPRGVLAVNTCARRALIDQRRSLLPVGIIRVDGRFQAGDTVSIVDEAGEEFARGLVSCDHHEAALVLGHRTDQIRRLTGRDDLQEIVHRDNLVLLGVPALRRSGVQTLGKDERE